LLFDVHQFTTRRPSSNFAARSSLKY
jgi:hypothetical protein